MDLVAISLIRRPCNCDQCRRTTWPKAESCLMDLRGAPASELEAIRQHVKSVQPYMVVAQHIDDRLSDEALRTLCNQQVNQGGYLLLNTRACPREQDLTWDTGLGFWTNLPGLIRSFAEPGEDLHLHYESARRVAESAVESAIARFQRTGLARRWDGTFFTAWPTPLIDLRQGSKHCNYNTRAEACW